MRKLARNIVVDILMLAAMASVSCSGYLLKEVCRRGVTFLGMGRRVWWDIHLWSGIVIVLLLFLHIALHWKTISGFFKKAIPNTALRVVVYVLLLALILIASVPWVMAEY